MKELARLKWACRRGMLELDLILTNFLAHQYDSLDLQQKFAFTELLACTDPEIYSWLISKATPPEQFCNIINLIKTCAPINNNN